MHERLYTLQTRKEIKCRLLQITIRTFLNCHCVLLPYPPYTVTSEFLPVWPPFTIPLLPSRHDIKALDRYTYLTKVGRYVGVS